MSKGQRIGYIRVSTELQNIDRQLADIELDKKFVDKTSGKNLIRDQYLLMMDYVREGDSIFVHSMDRLARNLYDLKKTVITLNQKGVKVHFVKENLIFNGDDNPMSNLLLSVMGAFAEFERDIILERVREGVKIAKMKGAYKGRKRILNSEQVIELKEMLKNGMRIVNIAKHFNVHRTSIYGYLKERKTKQLNE